MKGAAKRKRAAAPAPGGPSLGCLDTLRHAGKGGADPDGESYHRLYTCTYTTRTPQHLVFISFCKQQNRHEYYEVIVDFADA